jgi:type I restriction enzyme M protein
MSGVRTEAETVIKRILPYLRRRGYNAEKDIDFETAVQHPDRYTKGYVDLVVTCGQEVPRFVIEAKRNGKNLTAADAKQALDYGRAVKVPFVAVTNGRVVQVFNTATGDPLRWNGRLADRVPAKDDLTAVISFLRRYKTATDVPLGDGATSLPFRPALPLKQINDLFSRCHNKIRNIEKNEENAFADFSKILFLKLLEENAEAGTFKLPYSYLFWELAEKPAAQADQVKSAILEMLSKIKSSGYGDVLTEDIHIKRPETFRYIVQELAKVSFTDSDYDYKGAAFEYFVRATLKGKKLGQYFTPRELIKVMADLLGPNAIVGTLLAGSDVRLADPACGTGGFLVYLLKLCLSQLDDRLARHEITKTARKELADKLMGKVFHGADANDGVAAAAKMNMIIAGDGHNNIRHENSLLPGASLWPIGQAEYDFILTNPPFGTTEGDSLSQQDAEQYPVSGSLGGQYLFLQRMILATKPGGRICTVIDEGLLNTNSGKNLREWAMQHVRLLVVLHLPEDTFKPNKISIRSSVLLMERRETDDVDLLDDYLVTFCQLDSLGYYGSGDPIRGFDLDAVRASLREHLLDQDAGSPRTGIAWQAFDVSSRDIAADGTMRWDRKYWLPDVRKLSKELLEAGGETVKVLNTLDTSRGRSPASSAYVDESDGYAVMIKAGSCISRYGNIVIGDADWIEKATFDDMRDSAKLQVGDVVLASTGEGTAGKAAVYDLEYEAIADSHVTIIRPDPSVIDPHYLADYLRCGFGYQQIGCMFTGSTNLIELTIDDVNRIVVPLLSGPEEQRRLSIALRAAEADYINNLGAANQAKDEARMTFGTTSVGGKPIPEVDPF